MNKRTAESEPVYDLFDENDAFVKQGTRSASLKENLFTRSVHIFLVDEDGNILLCQRPLTKRTYPGMYTSSAGGHVEIGENHLVAAHRELKEELDIDLELTDFGRFDVVNNIESTIHHLLVGFPTKQDLGRIVFDSSEIAAHQYLSIEQIKQTIAESSVEFAQPFLTAFQFFLSKRQIIFDFDHTIFDWYSFKNDLQIALEKKSNVTKSQFEQAKEASETKANGSYNIEAHLFEIEVLTGTPVDKLRQVLDDLLKRGEQYLYVDALNLLKTLHADVSNILTLLTYGDDKNQLFFIRGTGAHTFFDRIIPVATKQEKTSWFKLLTHISNIAPYVINDDPEEAEQVIDLLPLHARHILIERPHAKYQSIPRHPNYEVYPDLHEIDLNAHVLSKETIPELASILTDGGIAVIPTDTIYGIVTQAQNKSAVNRLYDLKKRTPTKPFIILISSLDDIRRFKIDVDDKLKKQLSEYWPGPVSIILECLDPQFEYLHRGTFSLAFRFPDNENLRDLLRQTGPLVAPSANPEGLTPAQSIKEAKAYFQENVDMYLEGPTNSRPSKIIRISGGEVEVIRP